jgi:hypothetical protein
VSDTTPWRGPYSHPAVWVAVAAYELERWARLRGWQA